MRGGAAGGKNGEERAASTRSSPPAISQSQFLELNLCESRLRVPLCRNSSPNKSERQGKASQFPSAVIVPSHLTVHCHCPLSSEQKFQQLRTVEKEKLRDSFATLRDKGQELESLLGAGLQQRC